VENLLLGLQDARNPIETHEELRKMRGIVSQDILKSSNMTNDSFSVDDVHSWTKKNACVVFLHLYHSRIAMFYYRKLERALIGIKRSGSEYPAVGREADAGSDVRTSNAPSASLKSDLLDARAHIQSSAKRVFRLLNSLHLLGLLRYAPSYM
jgi:hypothetical protein